MERSHRTIKVIAARKNCTIAEAVFRYNVAPRDDESAESAPANLLYRYEVRVPGLDSSGRDVTENSSHQAPYRVGDGVWVRPPDARCVTRYDEGVVTNVMSRQAVEVDGMPRHVRDLRPRAITVDREVPEVPEDEWEESMFVWAGDDEAAELDGRLGPVNDAEPPDAFARRMSRRVRTPRTCSCCD